MWTCKHDPGSSVQRLALAPILIFLAASCSKVGSEPPKPASHEVKNLAWLAGAWEGPGFEGRVEEHWAAPEGGSMVGMFRLVAAGQTRVVQLMTIVKEEPGLILSSNHFTPQLHRWAREEEPLRFLLMQLTEVTAVFKCLSPQESLPDEMIYEQTGQDALGIKYRSRGETTTVLQLTRMEK